MYLQYARAGSVSRRCSDMSAIEQCTDFVGLIIEGAARDRGILRVADSIVRLRGLLAQCEVLLLLSAGLLEVAESSRAVIVALVCACVWS